MKRKVTCLFSLILYLLVAFTLTSVRIEKEMMTEVKIVTLKNRGGGFIFRPYVLFHDETGAHFYEVVSGTWESNALIHELPAGSWTQRFQGSVSYGGYAPEYRFVVAASRQPRDGEEAAIIKSFKTGNDQCLYYYADGVPEEIRLPKNTQIAAQNENALLLDMTESTLPFFPRTEGTLDTVIDQADHAFSLTETVHFLKQLPLVMAVFIVFAAGIVFWGMAWVFSSCRHETKKLIRFNTAFAILSLILLAVLLRCIDLPSSMLPAENIFDWQHYRSELSLIFDSLQGFHRTDILAIRDDAFRQTAVALYGGIGCIGAVLIAETIKFVHNTRFQKSKAS